ncbi:MAG: hypothetical protein KAI91_00045, partial [Candidatus Omnitrophica bacterium]|nr:hypothetical protein [Candidatus Omnitrophota bacterium]
MMVVNLIAAKPIIFVLEEGDPDYIKHHSDEHSKDILGVKNGFLESEYEELAKQIKRKADMVWITSVKDNEGAIVKYFYYYEIYKNILLILKIDNKVGDNPIFVTLYKPDLGLSIVQKRVKIRDGYLIASTDEDKLIDK